MTGTQSSSRIAILADDLTSALDGAAPFAGVGVPTLVLPENDPGRWDAALTASAEVVSVVLDSRFISPAEAEARFATAARCLGHREVVYKTIDSTLRGNVSAEIRGALAGSGRARAIVAPAFPNGGRTTHGGCQYIDGVPLEQTAFARDSRNPVATSRIADHLGGIPSDRVSIHDAENDRDLDRLVADIGLRADVVWVGSPGLGAALARAENALRQARSQSAAPRADEPTARRVLVVVGSLHPGNADQIASLQRAGAILLTTDDAVPVDPAAMVARLSKAFAQSSIVCLTSPRALRPAVDEAGQLANALGAIVAAAVGQFDGLVVTGGDTARRIVDAMRATAIDVLGEIESGVPIGSLHMPTRPIAFATKAGGFGNAGTLLSCVARLQSLQERTHP